MRQKYGLLLFCSEGGYVLVTRQDRHEGQKHRLWWRGPRHVTKCVSDYVFQVDGCQNGARETVRYICLKLYAYKSRNTAAILSHVLSAETGMPVSRLVQLSEENVQLCFVVRSKVLSNVEKKNEPLQNVYEDALQLFVKFFKHETHFQLSGTELVSNTSSNRWCVAIYGTIFDAVFVRHMIFHAEWHHSSLCYHHVRPDRECFGNAGKGQYWFNNCHTTPHLKVLWPNLTLPTFRLLEHLLIVKPRYKTIKVLS